MPLLDAIRVRPPPPFPGNIDECLIGQTESFVPRRTEPEDDVAPAVAIADLEPLFSGRAWVAVGEKARCSVHRRIDS
jgi:hypothetical protein